MGAVPGLGLGARQLLDHGVEVVGLSAQVAVMVQDLDVSEFIEDDVLDVLAAVGPARVGLAPAQGAPVEAVALFAHPDGEARRRIAGEARKSERAAGRTRSIANKVRRSGRVG